VRLPNGGHTRIGQRDSGRLAGSPSARWSGTEPAIKPLPRGGSRLWSNQGKGGACAPALKPHLHIGKVHGRKAKASNRTTGNPAVRHYRGATGNVAMVGMRTRLAIERAGTETPHLKRGAPVLYPNKKQVSALGGTVGMGGQASGKRLAEITSGTSGWQQGLSGNLQRLLERGYKPKDRRGNGMDA
jgi:hypothetical protein